MEVKVEKRRFHLRERGSLVANRSSWEQNWDCSSLHADQLSLLNQLSHFVLRECSRVFAMALQVDTMNIRHIWNKVALVRLISNICSNILLYYPSPIIESVSPEPKPYIRESRAIDQSDNHLRRSVMPQQDPRACNCAGPRDSDHCNEGAKQRIFRK
jgi:hypothetical protein